MRTMTRRAAVLMLAVLGAHIGCAGPQKAPIEPGVYHFAHGEMTNRELVSMDRAFLATQSALTSLEFRPQDQSKDALQAYIAAQMADNREVKVRLYRVGDNVTDFRVKVGPFGDEEKSRLVMDRIRRSL